MEGPTHSVIVKGNIKNSGQLNILLPNTILQYGLWQICIKTISYQSFELVNKSISIDSNFVSDVRYSSSNEIEPYNSVLCMVVLKASVNEIKIFQLNETWFVANCVKPLLELTIRDSSNNTIVNDVNVSFQILVLFKQIR